MRLFSVLTCCICFLLVSFGLAPAAETDKDYKLIFSTFDNTSAKDYAFLRDSIQTMLMSRLSANDAIEVVDKVLSKKEVTALAKNHSSDLSSIDADYMVTGSIYALAHGIKVQITMYPFNAENEVLNFSQLSETPNDIIAGNDALINAVVGKLFGESTVETRPDFPGEATAGFTTTHPEAEYKKGLYSGTIVDSDLHGIQAKARGVKRTLDISGGILACTVGDLNGNGSDEIITLTSSNINIYQSQERKIIQIDSLKLPNGLRSHGLTVADLNGDGKKEIYISATDDLWVASMIIGWNGKGNFTTFAKNIRWYLRPVKNTNEAWQLAGQKRGRAKTDFLAKGLYWLNIDENFKISENKRIGIPDSINLFDFAFAELDGKKGDELVVLDTNEKLQVISNNNELLWVSESNYGGSKIYIGPSIGSAVDEQSKTGLSVDEDADRELIFVPARILVTDVDGDGLSEVVVNENKSGTLGFLKRLRSYDGGSVVGLIWNGEALTEAWKTGHYKGYLVDYGFRKTENTSSIQPGKSGMLTSSGQLYVANMPLSGTFIGMLPGTNDTKITVYDLDFYKQKQVDNN
ncbi:FG-GAP repeat domain-containing protein [Desulforhopalus sp. 52FAK]